MEPDDLVSAVLEYAAAGIPVFPCGQDKRPLVKNWRQVATTDPAQLQAWWRAWPVAMIGIPTGTRSGLYVVDIDQRGSVDGMANYRALGVPRASVAAFTPSGGGHAYFHFPGEGCGSSTSAIAPGIDTRGEGGFVIAPPSGNGIGEYRWIDPDMKGRLFRRELTELPEALRWLLRKSKLNGAAAAPDSAAPKWSAAALRNEINRVASVGEGQRNDTLNVAAFNLGQIVAAGHLLRSEVEQALGAAALDAGLGADESRRTILSGLAAGEASPRGPASATTPPSAEAVSSPNLVHLEPRRDPPPQFPGADVFGDAWGRWLDDVAAATATPPDYAGIALLAIAGSLVGNSRRVSPWGDWNEPPIVWGMAIGEPSSGKTPALSLATAPLLALESKVRVAAEAERSAWQGKADLAAMHREKWESDVRDALKAGLEPPPCPAETDPGEAPCVPRLVVQDVTVEKLGEILGGQPGGCLMLRDELAGFLQSMNRYNNGGGDRPFYLEAYNGAQFSVDRLCREAILIKRLSVGLLGGIQPDRLASILMKTNDNDGFLARFCPVWPEVVPVERPTRSPDMTWAEKALARIYALEMDADADGDRVPVCIPLAEDAAGELLPYYNNLRLTEHKLPSLLKSFAGKTPGMIARISLVLAMLDWAVSEEPAPPTEISLAYLRRARLYVTEYLFAMARRTYAEAAKPKSERGATALLRILRDERLVEISKAEIRGRKLDGLRDAKDIDAALAVLVEANVLCERPVPTGGRPKIVFDVSPTIWS